MLTRRRVYGILAGAALAVALLVALSWRGGGDRIERYRRAGDAEALAEVAAGAEADVAKRAAHALGALGPKAAPHLRKVLADERPEIRQRAAIALGRAAGREAGPALAAVAEGDRSTHVRAAAVTALGRARAFDQMPALLAALEDPSETVRRRAREAIADVTGIEFNFPVSGSPQARRQAIARIRALWAKMEPDVRSYHTADRAKR